MSACGPNQTCRKTQSMSLLGVSGHGLVRCTCPLLTQSGHQNWRVQCSNRKTAMLNVALPMFLSFIEPSDEMDYDQRTFECSTCANAETATVSANRQSTWLGFPWQFIS